MASTQERYFGRILIGNEAACDTYIKAVGAQLAIDSPGVANPMPDEVGADNVIAGIKHDTSTWEQILGLGPHGGPAAEKASGEGHLVLALLEGGASHDGNAHLAVVIPGPLNASYPHVICGSSRYRSDPRCGGYSDGRKWVYSGPGGDTDLDKRGVWSSGDALKVQYYQTKAVFQVLK